MSEKEESLDAEINAMLQDQFGDDCTFTAENSSVFAAVKSLILQREELAWEAVAAMLKEAAEYLEDVRDEGPEHAGWKSDELLGLIGRINDWREAKEK
jgi:hypothetical protein